MQRKLIRTVWLVLLFSGLAAAQSAARGQLEVTALVESSAAWVQGEGGNWMLVVANAPASRDILSDAVTTRHDQKPMPPKKPGQTKAKQASLRQPKA